MSPDRESRSLLILALIIASVIVTACVWGGKTLVATVEHSYGAHRID